jgi:hypothetical protein
LTSFRAKLIWTMVRRVRVECRALTRLVSHDS